MSNELKIGIIAGRSGGDFIAMEKAHKAGLVNYKIAGFACTSAESSALKIYTLLPENSRPLILEKFGRNKEENFSKLNSFFQNENPDYIFLCGFSFLLPVDFISAFRNRIINSHHSQLPSDPGLFKKEELVMRGYNFLGATLHFADEGMDTGTVISQAVFTNFGMEHFHRVLAVYRFVQDVLIVQQIRKMSGREATNAVSHYRNILFSPAVEEEVLNFFSDSYEF
jgi:phosphoribosylglycinamide formyltransferase 1